MTPSEVEIRHLHEKYALNDKLLYDVYTHCKITTEIALWCAKSNNLTVDEQLLRAGCMLHDIGSYVFLNGKDIGRSTYPQHAIFGSSLLHEEGVNDQICEMIKTHVLLGLTKEEIIAQKIALPYKNYEPQTLEAKLLCYADRFSSKGNGLVINKFDTLLAKFQKDLPLQAEKFENWARNFGIPDTNQLALKYIAPKE